MEFYTPLIFPYINCQQKFQFSSLIIMKIYHVFAKCLKNINLAILKLILLLLCLQFKQINIKFLVTKCKRLKYIGNIVILSLKFF